MGFSFDNQSGEYKFSDNTYTNIVVATNPQVESFTKQMDNWLSMCNVVIGITAFNLGLGAAGTSDVIFHSVFSILFIMALHFYGYKTLTKSFFKFKVTTPGVPLADLEKLTVEFRTFIRLEHFPAGKMAKKTPIWFFGVGYLFLVFLSAALLNFESYRAIVTLINENLGTSFSLF